MHERLIAYLDPSEDNVLKIEELEVDLEVSMKGKSIVKSSPLIQPFSIS